MNVRLVVKKPTRRERIHDGIQGLMYYEYEGAEPCPVVIQTRRNKQSMWETVEIVYE